MAARLRLSSPGSLFDGSSLDAEDDRRTAARSPLTTRPHVWGSFFNGYVGNIERTIELVFVPMFGDLFLTHVREGPSHGALRSDLRRGSVMGYMGLSPQESQCRFAQDS